MTTLLNRIVEQSALKAPAATAVRCDGTTLSYEQLARRVNGLARVLVDTGVTRGDRVAVWLGKGTLVPVGFYGTFAAGGVLVPIDPKSPVDQVAGILRATGATHLVTEPQRRDGVLRALAASSGLTHIIGLDQDDGLPVRCTPWTAVDEAAADRAPDVAIAGGDAAYILHTSGSTGQPKLILHTHSSAISFVDWAVGEYDLTGSDRITNHSSHHTCFATFDFYAAAHAGAATVILTPAMMRMPASLSAHLEQEQVTVWYSVPAALVQLSLRGDLEARDLRALRWVLFAGETFPTRHLRRIRQQLPSARFSHVYGSTEVNVCTYYHLPEGAVPDGALPIGRACTTAETLVADAGMRAVPAGEIGDLFVRGATVMSGYWNDEERNRHALVRPAADGDERPYFRTGDRARLLDDGNLAFIARADRQVKIRGHRLELDEVEGALLSLDAVEEAAAFTVPDEEGSSALWAAIVAAPHTAASERELLDGLREILPPHAVPSRLDIVGSMPRTATGKVDTRMLIAQAMERVSHDGR